MVGRSLNELEEIARSADPPAVRAALERIVEARPGAAERIAADAGLRAALVAVTAASPWLARLCATEEAALEVLAELETPLDVAVIFRQEGASTKTPASTLSRARGLALLRVAARDLLGLDDLEEVGAALARLGSEVLQQGLTLTATEDLAVIGMGKLGGGELNYSSDLDILLVAQRDAERDARRFLGVVRPAWRVDLDLRPEGRAGPLVRTLASYSSYWDRWAQTWEFQALVKARYVAGNPELGAAFEREAASRVWGRPFGADDLRQVRHLKGRAEEEVTRRGLAERELKTGRGGIRDVEFAVQLLQLVHGRADPSLRSPSTLAALRALAAGGYVSSEDARALEQAYVFLRTVEHRLQLEEDQQVHALPSTREGKARLARVLGYRDGQSSTALGRFEADLRLHQSAVRSIHERLFFRPLLEAFTSPSGPLTTGLTPPAVEERLRAFGFTDAARTRRAVQELTRGFSRTSRLMQQMLPVLLDWLSAAPDPDLGLLGLRTLAGTPHCREQLTSLCRESPSAARNLCQLLGTGPRFARSFQRHPDLIGELATGELLAGRSRSELLGRLRRWLAWRSGEAPSQEGLRLFAQAETVRIAARDVLGAADVVGTGQALSDLAEAVLEAAVEVADIPVPLAIIGMGRLGGQELAYSSDLDLLFVYGEPSRRGPAHDDAELSAQAEAAVSNVVRLIAGSTPASGVYRVDTALRPEGRQGPQARSVDAYAAYYARWARVWERQALLRARFVAGDSEVASRFEEVAGHYLWGQPLTEAEVREIRRTKARVERERVPASEDPAFHLKLGPGALADVEWTVQLLQLRHRVPACGTMEALNLLVQQGLVTAEDGRVLEEAYRFCEQARNRLALVRDVPGNSLPGPGPHLTLLARSLGTTPSGLRDEYRRRTRRARKVVERLFYGADASGS